MNGSATRLLAGVLAVLVLVGGARGANPMLAEVRLEPATSAERDAGVWVDGQYFGFVRELRGKNRLVLLPGRYELSVRLAGYEEFVTSIDVEPGEARRFRVRLEPRADASYPDAEQTASVRLNVAPARAALFVNGTYAGPVERFSGRDGLRLRAGTHRFRVALPGYRPFETEMTLAPSQRYELKAELAVGAMSDQPEDIVARGGSIESASPTR